MRRDALPCVFSDRQSGRRFAVVSSDRQSGSDKNVHRVGRVSGGLLNPSGGARNRPRNKSVLAQLENELNYNFASGAKIRLTFFLEKMRPHDNKTTRQQDRSPVVSCPTPCSTFGVLRWALGVGRFPRLSRVKGLRLTRLDPRPGREST
jgi:hypothetical protein